MQGCSAIFKPRDTDLGRIIKKNSRPDTEGGEAAGSAAELEVGLCLFIAWLSVIS